MCQPELPLFVFQILLFRGCQVKVTLFKSPSFKRSSRWKALPSKIPDVRSISAVSRSQLAPLASFIQLHGEAAEVVVDLGVSRPRGSLKVIFTLTALGFFGRSPPKVLNCQALRPKVEVGALVSWKHQGWSSPTCIPREQLERRGLRCTGTRSTARRGRPASACSDRWWTPPRSGDRWCPRTSHQAWRRALPWARLSGRWSPSFPCAPSIGCQLEKVNVI